MLKAQGDTKYSYKKNDRVEIQVVSALANAWAEGKLLTLFFQTLPLPLRPKKPFSKAWRENDEYFEY